jgi:hypothetical protein
MFVKIGSLCSMAQWAAQRQPMALRIAPRWRCRERRAHLGRVHTHRIGLQLTASEAGLIAALAILGVLVALFLYPRHAEATPLPQS